MKNLQFLALAILLLGCDSGSDKDPYFHGDPDPVDPDCTSVRLTAYNASSGGWCEYDRTSTVLPDFVRSGMTLAIAEPWNGGSYEGEPGEACGECWEIDTIYETQTVMVHDLCPIEGNPLCSGWYFHFDLASEAAAALGGGGLDAAVARRVPCPVTGNIHVQVNDWNQWGYVRVAFINHTIPVRTAEVQFTSLGTWHPMERSGGAWHLLDHPSPAAQDAILFRITSARGETVISENPVPLMDPGKFFDTGVQFVDTGEAATGECLFYPPADVYHDSWGGIDQVKWQPNPWGDATVSETSSDCYDGSASCLAVRNMEQWGGMHIYYRQEFPPSTFTALSFWIRAVSGSGTLTVALSRDGERCTEHDIAVDNEWTQVSLDPAVDCAGFPFINGITFSNTSPEFPFNLDEIHFDLP